MRDGVSEFLKSRVMSVRVSWLDLCSELWGSVYETMWCLGLGS